MVSLVAAISVAHSQDYLPAIANASTGGNDVLARATPLVFGALLGFLLDAFFSPDQTAGFDQAAGAGFAPNLLEFGFLFGKPGFVLFMSTKALSKRTGHAVRFLNFLAVKDIVVRGQCNPQQGTFCRRATHLNLSELRPHGSKLAASL